MSTSLIGCFHASCLWAAMWAWKASGKQTNQNGGTRIGGAWFCTNSLFLARKSCQIPKPTTLCNWGNYHHSQGDKVWCQRLKNSVGILQMSIPNRCRSVGKKPFCSWCFEWRRYYQASPPFFFGAGFIWSCDKVGHRLCWVLCKRLGREVCYITLLVKQFWEPCLGFADYSVL